MKFSILGEPCKDMQPSTQHAIILCALVLLYSENYGKAVFGQVKTKPCISKWYNYLMNAICSMNNVVRFFT